MIVLSGATLVLPDRLLSPGTLVIDDGRIAEIRPDTASDGHPASHFAFHGHCIGPGFVAVHGHGVDGIDTLDAGESIGSIAERLPRYGVTAFCPTTVACAPAALRRVLDQVRVARATPVALAARVLPAHLESNFINPAYRGAQPASCLRSPVDAVGRCEPDSDASVSAGADFTAADVLREIERATPDVAIVTLASELEGGLDLIGWLTGRGHRVSLGHSAATFDQGVAAIAAGASQATHLFNRMPPLGHREPGLAGAVLQSNEVAAEIICDAVHVHPGMVRATVAAKHSSRVMAITDATAAAGLPLGGCARLGGQSIVAGESTAVLADGTVAGSVATMERIFQKLVGVVGLSLVEAALLCSTTACRELGLVSHGLLAPGAAADLVVLDGDLAVVQTYVGGQLVYSRNTPLVRSV